MTEDVRTVHAPPLAPRRPQVLEIHGDRRVDEWYWLRQREDPDVVAYLEAENAYLEAATAHTKPLQEKLFEEFKARIQETDLSAPVFHGGFWYYTRTVEGLQYAIRCRAVTRPSGDAPPADEQVLIDENVMAEGHDFFALRGFVVSPDHRLLAYTVNTDGSDRDELHVRDLESGRDLADVIPEVSSNLAWASDNATLFYVRYDAALRPHRLWRHSLGAPPDDDVLVYEEDDEVFRIGVTRSKSGAYLQLASRSSTTTEVRILRADDPTNDFRVVEPRSPGVEYGLTHHGDRFFVVSNADGAQNFALLEAPADDPRRERWRPVLPYDDSVRLFGLDAFADHLVLYERAKATRRIRVMHLASGAVHEIDQPEAVSTSMPGANPEFGSRTLRYGYSSMVTPPSVFEYDMDARSRELLKQDSVLGGFDAANYATYREWATAPDGTRVPVSIVHRKGFGRDGTAPCLLYGYGSYEASSDPVFGAFRLSLLDRGFVYAIAHIRGGGELGRSWYEDGKFLNKRNTFTDFVAAAEHLVAERLTSTDRLVAQGASAGGLLVGAAVNLRPDLFRAVVAQVPFVDVVTTMLDESIPLTVGEFEEWGNPKDPDYYRYMKSYSPYDNVQPREYPALLVTTGLNDTRVAFWEPAKWVAKLRVTKTDANPLVLKTQLGAGHGGPSGRYNAWRETAFVYAFILDSVGIHA